MLTRFIGRLRLNHRLINNNNTINNTIGNRINTNSNRKSINNRMANNNNNTNTNTAATAASAAVAPLYTVSHTPSKPLNISAAWEFYRSIGSPRYVVAPMVNQSELAFRVLTRKYGAQLTYTPMIHAANFSKSLLYRQQNFSTDPTVDSPLFAQFCGNDPLTILTAAKFIENQCSAIDINFGCPQGIAKRGHYGSFLLTEPELIGSILSTLYDNLSIPVTCKIRLLPNEADTMNLINIIQNSGCSLLTVHGRTREQMKDRVGPTDFAMIKKIKSIIKIPLISNGSIESLIDVQNCIDYTGVDGVMTSEGILCNPALFSGVRIDSIIMARQYLDLAIKYSADSSQIRAHLFKILFRELTVHTEFRNLLGSTTGSNEEFLNIIDELDIVIQQYRADPIKSLEYNKVSLWYKRHITNKINKDNNNTDNTADNTNTYDRQAELVRKLKAKAAATAATESELESDMCCDATFGCYTEAEQQ